MFTLARHSISRGYLNPKLQRSPLYHVGHCCLSSMRMIGKALITLLDGCAETQEGCIEIIHSIFRHMKVVQHQERCQVSKGHGSNGSADECASTLARRERLLYAGDRARTSGVSTAKTFRITPLDTATVAMLSNNWWSFVSL